MAERGRILHDDEDIAGVLRDSKRLAVLGIKPESHASRPAHYVPAYLQRNGYEIVPVPVYYPDVTEILGEQVPEHLRVAGELRLQHKQASLEELGQLADPPMTKDAVAGRIRRLLAMADKQAEELGVEGTEANLTADMLDD